MKHNIHIIVIELFLSLNLTCQVFGAETTDSSNQGGEAAELRRQEENRLFERLKEDILFPGHIPLYPGAKTMKELIKQPIPGLRELFRDISPRRDDRSNKTHHDDTAFENSAPIATATRQVSDGSIPRATRDKRSHNKDLPRSIFSPENAPLKVRSNNQSITFVLGTYDKVNIDGQYTTSKREPELTRKNFAALKGSGKHYLSLKVSVKVQPGQREYPLLLPKTEGLRPYFPVTGSYANFRVSKKSTGQYFLTLNNDPTSEWLDLNVDGSGWIDIEYFQDLTTKKLELSSYEASTSPWPDKFKKLREIIEQEMTAQYELFKREYLDDPWAQEYSYQDIVQEMYCVWGFNSPIIEEIIAYRVAKILSEDYHYAVAADERTPLQALKAGSFQCDTAAVLMVCILRDIYQIPAQIVVTYPGALLEVKKGEGSWSSDKYVVAPDTTGPSHAIVEVNGHYFDPTPKRQ